jgi:cell division protein FtsB
MALKDCANRRLLIEALAADYRSLDATTTATEKELAALEAGPAAPESVAAVQERLAAEHEQLGQLAIEGRAAVDEFRAVCGGEELPPRPWPPG